MKNSMHGVTLIEILLILVLVTVFFMTGINYQQQNAETARNDLTALQMQYILNAGLTYYVSNGSWATSLPALVAAGYLPNGGYTNPWGYPYTISTSGNLLSVNSYIKSTLSGVAAARAYYIAGKLPNGYTLDTTTGQPCTTTTTQCWVSAVVPVTLPSKL